VLDGHRISGDRSHKHHEQNKVREALRSYVESKTEVARRESARHNRRLHDLTGEQQKLVQLNYKGGVSEEVMKAEQERIESERTKAQQWADAAEREVEDVMAALDDALTILDDKVIYEFLPESARRLVNQAVFLALVVPDPDNIQAQLTPLFETIARLVQELRETKERPQTGQKRPRTLKNRTGSPQNSNDPDFWGRGSYKGQLAGTTGGRTRVRHHPLRSAPGIARPPSTTASAGADTDLHTDRWSRRGTKRVRIPTRGTWASMSCASSSSLYPSAQPRVRAL
jgi:hypothetical protein